jgi:hypothetical protein
LAQFFEFQCNEASEDDKSFLSASQETSVLQC